MHELMFIVDSYALYYNPNFFYLDKYLISLRASFEYKNLFMIILNLMQIISSYYFEIKINFIIKIYLASIFCIAHFNLS